MKSRLWAWLAILSAICILILGSCKALDAVFYPQSTQSQSVADQVGHGIQKGTEGTPLETLGYGLGGAIVLLGTAYKLFRGDKAHNDNAEKIAALEAQIKELKNPTS